MNNIQYYKQIWKLEFGYSVIFDYWNLMIDYSESGGFC